MIHSITEDSKGNMWFATNGGAYMFDGKALINISAKAKFLSNFVNQIIESSNGKYLVSTTNGLFRYDGNSFYNLTGKLLGENEGVVYIFVDINGTICFTANKRDIYSYNGETFQKIQIKKGKFSPLPFQIYQDQQNRLWFVGFKGAYRLENNAFVNVTRFGPW
jgi:ligand-binding sensor domain-containing protein